MGLWNGPPPKLIHILWFPRMASGPPLSFLPRPVVRGLLHFPSGPGFGSFFRCPLETFFTLGAARSLGGAVEMGLSGRVGQNKDRSAFRSSLLGIVLWRLSPFRIDRWHSNCRK
uniref:Uncharacterized protein n=1 Tax=Nelumbo nucifera TaxID=4432 RepID=A0A822Y118_NELNU|nr:TPA_asm: hypothetical protein HUJ06_026229 [Nelumbo nucifera]